MTKVHHITYYDDRLKLAHIQFLDCNLSCKGCLRNLGIWDWHLPLVDITKLERLPENCLRLKDFKNIILGMKEGLGIKRAVLGGGEPTVDPKICQIVSFLSSSGIEVTMETNAYLLGEELTLKLLKAGLSSTVVSLKAQREELHHFYTGVSPKLILGNFHKAYKLGLNLEVVSVFIPDLVEKEEIEKIAQFVSSIDLKIPYTVIPFIPVPQAEWRQPRAEEIKEAAEVC